MTTIYLVGGAVRDRFLGVLSKDLDFSVEAESFDAMRDHLKSQGFKIFLETPQYLTIRARFPQGHANSSMTADFVLCRKDGEYTDGRRPDEVVPGTIYDDLARRDFTVNAIALAEDGTLIDPHDGREDLRGRRLKAVGDPMDRITEDALRALRAIRFSITKDLWIDADLLHVLRSHRIPPLLEKIAIERVREELVKAFRHDTVATLETLHEFSTDFRDAIFRDGLWLKPTLEA